MSFELHWFAVAYFLVLKSLNDIRKRSLSAAEIEQIRADTPGVAIASISITRVLR